MNNKQPVVALFDMGATCSCIDYKTFQSIMNNSEIKNDKISVVQANGQSLNQIGTVKLNVTLGKERFLYKFVVCKNLKTLLILGLDFAEFHMIGFDWNSDRSAYLRFENKKLISPLPRLPSEKTDRHLKTEM